MEKLLTIYSDTLLNKVKDFIYVYSVPQMGSPRFLPNMPIILGAEEPFSWDIIQSRRGIDKLRSVSDTSTTGHEWEQKIKDRVNLFLIHLCSGSKEASLDLENVLNGIMELGERGFDLECTKRLTGILAATILTYYCSDRTLRHGLSHDMRFIFRNNLAYYTPNDKDYLITLFWQCDELDCLECILETLTWNQRGSNSDNPFVKAFVRICDMYKKGIYSNGFSSRYQEGEKFIRKCEGLFNDIPEIQKQIWYIELAMNLFGQNKYEEAEVIWSKFIENDRYDDFFVLYNAAILCVAVAEKKEKNESEWIYYIEKALEYIEKSICRLPTYDANEDTTIKGQRIEYYLEKSFLLAEKEHYEEAYICLKEANRIACENGTHYAMTDSNYNTHFWIILQYLKTHPDSWNVIIDALIESASGELYRFPASYHTVFTFLFQDKFLKVNEKYRNTVYKHLLLTLLHAQEIKHISKIRDLSRYEFVYYTKLSNLTLLFEDEKDNQHQYRLPLFHAYHMNDPQEGRILYDFLNSGYVDHPQHNLAYEENYVFLKSFFSYLKKDGKAQVKEFLPMWVQYGDDAKGCCVVLNEKTFEGSNLRKITYLSDKGLCDCERMNNLLLLFREHYQKSLEICNTIIEEASPGDEWAHQCVAGIQSTLKYIVSQITYLFKHDSYKHENEVRIIKTLSENDLDAIKKISGDIPKTYIYNDTQTFIDEIILGSKVQNPDDYVPFFCLQGRKMWKTQPKDQITITHSFIQYR